MTFAEGVLWTWSVGQTRTSSLCARPFSFTRVRPPQPGFGGEGTAGSSDRNSSSSCVSFRAKSSMIRRRSAASASPDCVRSGKAAAFSIASAISRKARPRGALPSGHGRCHALPLRRSSPRRARSPPRESRINSWGQAYASHIRLIRSWSDCVRSCRFCSGALWSLEAIDQEPGHLEGN